MNQLRIGIIGVGFIGQQHIEAIRRIPSAKVVAVCSRDPLIAAKAGKDWNVNKIYTNWRELLKDGEIDVVHNCTPNAMHDQINQETILTGRHIYSEKPLSSSALKAREVLNLAIKHGVAHGLNHQYRMNAAVQEMRALVSKREFGGPLLVFGHYLQESASMRTDWNRKMENTGMARALNDIGIHWVDTACCVLGQPVHEVMADLFIHHPYREDTQNNIHKMDTEDTGMVLLHFADGTPGQMITSKATSGHKNDLMLNVACERSSIRWQQEMPDKLVVSGRDVGSCSMHMNPKTCQRETLPYITAPMGHVMGWPDALRNAIRAYYESILRDTYKQGNQCYATFRDGFHGMAFVEACLKSHISREWVEVEAL